MELQIVGMLCALAAATFAARPAQPRTIAVLAAGFVLAAVVFTPARFPPPAALATLAAVAAGLELVRPNTGLAIAFVAGWFAGCWIAVLETLGAPFVPAALAAAVLLVAAARLAATRSDFATPRLREEALLLVGGFALAAAVGPEILAGWKSAVSFKTEPLGAAAEISAAWLPAFVIGCVALGGMYSLWKRR